MSIHPIAQNISLLDANTDKELQRSELGELYGELEKSGDVGKKTFEIEDVKLRVHDAAKAASSYGATGLVKRAQDKVTKIQELDKKIQRLTKKYEHDKSMVKFVTLLKVGVIAAPAAFIGVGFVASAYAPILGILTIILYAVAMIRGFDTSRESARVGRKELDMYENEKARYLREYQALLADLLRKNRESQLTAKVSLREPEEIKTV